MIQRAPAHHKLRRVPRFAATAQRCAFDSKSAPRGRGETSKRLTWTGGTNFVTTSYHMSRLFVILLLACLIAPVGAAQEPPSPDSAQKEVSPDEAALRAALKALAKAPQDGDGKAIRHAIYASNATERKMVDAMSAMAVQIAELYKASSKAFGEEQAKGLTGDMGAEMSRIDDAKVSIEGDTATVTYEQPETPKPEPPAAPDPAKTESAVGDESDDTDDAASPPPP